MLPNSLSSGIKLSLLTMMTLAAGDSTLTDKLLCNIAYNLYILTGIHHVYFGGCSQAVLKEVHSALAERQICCN